MNTNLPSDNFHEERASPAAGRPMPESAQTTRIDRLFRDSLRQQRVHPLRDLIKQYRQRGAS